MDERLYWLGFSVFPGIGPARFNMLLNHFGSAKDVWNAKTTDLKAAGIGETLTQKFDDFRNTFLFQEYMKKMEDKQVAFFTLFDKEYPELLKKNKKSTFCTLCKREFCI